MLIALPFIANSVLSFVVGLLVAKLLGPTEYGKFALAFSIAVVVETLAFEWLRLSALRFYSESERRTHPQIRATLNAAFGAVAAALFSGAALAFALRPPLAPSSDLAALAGVAAVSSGAFDLAAGLARARFQDRVYAALVVSKNLLALALMGGGAWAFGSADAAMIGFILCAFGSVACVWRALRDPAAARVRPQRAVARLFAAYAAPIVAANLLYQLVPMLNRWQAAETLDYARSGQLALAFEVGVRVIGAVGSSLDVVLFQLAVHSEKTEGLSQARARVGRNIGAVVAIVLPAAVGLWAVSPSFELLLVPESFRGPFAHYFALMLPALIAFAIMNYALYPLFQIERRTLPLAAAALVGLVADLVALALLPAGADASKYAIAQSVSSVAGLAALLVAIAAMARAQPDGGRAFRPRARDLVGAMVGAAAMLAAIWPLRALSPGLLTLSTQIILGALVYGLALWALNVADLRTLVRARRPRPTGGPHE